MKNTTKLTTAGIIAAMYVALTFLSYGLGLSSGPIQIRISEALTLLPVVTSSAVPGLFVGCILANIMTGCAFWDIVFGAIATLIGAYGTRIFRKFSVTAPIFPILSNSIIIPAILKYVYQFEGAYWYFVITVAIGEIISCGILGNLLMRTLKKSKVLEMMPK